MPIELITKKKVATDEFITDLNGIYKLMWTQASWDKTFMKKKWLRDNPVADLAAFIDDITYLPSLKLKLDPLYRKVRDTVRIYEKSIDVSKDAWRWVQKKERKGVVLDPVSNNQLVRETGATTWPVDTDYLFHDATVIPQSATPYAWHTRKISVVDDQWNDCSSFVTLEGDGFHLKTQDLLRKHPDVVKLVITRPMVLSGEWCSNGIYVPIQGVEADFVDEISFWWLDNVVRMTLMTDFFNNRAQKEVLTRWLCAPDATAACKSLLKSLFRKNYSTSQEKYIHEALRLEVTETIEWTPELDAESGFYTSCGIVPITYADRLIYAYLFEKANVSRTTSAYEVHIEELLATPKNLFTKKLDEDRCRELVTKIDFLIASQPTIDVDALLSDYTEWNVDVMNLLYAANQPHADAAKKTYVVNNFLDNVFWSEGYFWKKRRTFRLRRQSHSLLWKDRVKFWELDEVHDYWFIMWLWDNEGEEKNKKVALSGEVVDYENIDVRIVITSATSIDIDIDVPAQKWSPSLKFDGARWTPDGIRTQMDSQITPDKWWDWKLGLGAKIQLEEHLYDRLVKQHGDVSSRITSTSAPPNSKLFTLSKWDSGMVIMDKSVIPPQTFTMEQCENERQAKVFLQLVRNILDNHCKSIKELLFNGATNPTDVILWFPKLSTIESANGSTPDDYEGERSEEKKFGATTVKVTYKSDEKWSYKLYVSDGIKEEEFDSVWEVVMSARYWSFALDLMHWFHEKLLEEFLLKRKDLPRDRTYFVQDPITQDRYGFYNEWNEIHYWVVSTLPNTGVKWLTTWQKLKDVDPDPKHRCVMSVWKATFVKWSEEIAKKTIFWRKDLFYSLLFTAMATSESWPKERDYREAQKKKRNESAASLRNTVKDVGTWTALFDIVKTAFGSTKKK